MNTDYHIANDENLAEMVRDEMHMLGMGAKECRRWFKFNGKPYLMVLTSDRDRAQAAKLKARDLR